MAADKVIYIELKKELGKLEQYVSIFTFSLDSKDVMNNPDNLPVSYPKH